MAEVVREEEEEEEEEEEDIQGVRAELLGLGRMLLDWVGTHCRAVLSNHRQLFLASRLPPYCEPGPKGVALVTLF